MDYDIDLLMWAFPQIPFSVKDGDVVFHTTNHPSVEELEAYRDAYQRHQNRLKAEYEALESTAKLSDDSFAKAFEYLIVLQEAKAYLAGKPSLLPDEDKPHAQEIVAKGLQYKKQVMSNRVKRLYDVRED